MEIAGVCVQKSRDKVVVFPLIDFCDVYFRGKVAKQIFLSFS